MLAHIEPTPAGKRRVLRPLPHDLSLPKSGLDSLGAAVAVMRLEEAPAFGFFSHAVLISPPVTHGEFIGACQRLP